MTLETEKRDATQPGAGHPLVLEMLRSQLGLEEARIQSLNSRGANLVGFGTVVVSLLTLTASDQLDPRATESPGWAEVLLVVALALLVIAIAIILAGVLRPRLPCDFSAEELIELDAQSDPVAVRSTLVCRLGEAVERGREISNDKAKALTWAGYCLFLAVLLGAIAGAAITL